MPRVIAPPKQRRPSKAQNGNSAKGNGKAAAAAADPPSDPMAAAAAAAAAAATTTVMANGTVPAHPPVADPARASSDSEDLADTTPVHPKKRRGLDAHRAKAAGLGAKAKAKITKTKRAMTTLAKANALKRTAPPSAAATNGASEAPSAKKKRHWRQGTVALREIRRQQKSVHTIIPDAPFVRLVREVLAEQHPDGAYKITGAAYAAMKQASEGFLVDLFRDAQVSAVSHQREGIKTHDLRLVMRLRGELHKYPQLAAAAGRDDSPADGAPGS